MEYTDESFREEKQRSEEEEHLGILGRNHPATNPLPVPVRTMLMLGVPVSCNQPLVAWCSEWRRRCFTAVASKPEGDRCGCGTVELTVTFLLGQSSEVSVVLVTRTKQVTVIAPGYVFLTEHLQGMLQIPFSHRKLPLLSGCSFCYGQVAGRVVKRDERRK